MKPEHCGTGLDHPDARWFRYWLDLRAAGRDHMQQIQLWTMRLQPPQLEAPTRFWYQCADTRLDPCPRPSRYCMCSDAPYGCGGCCSCLGGCVEQHDEADHWAAVRRRWYGQLEPCSCLPVWEDAGDGWALSSTSCYTINPDCPHHGDVAHGCTCRVEPGWYPGRPAAALCPLHGTHRRTCPGVAFLGRSRHSEGCGWRCPDCGATYTLTRVQDVDPAVRLYPTMQWIRNT